MFRIHRSPDRLSIFSNAYSIRLLSHGVGPSTSKRSFYDVLGVSSKASQTEIKDAFFALSKKYHPDVNKDETSAHERFVEINEAYAVLSKPDSRSAYDAKLESSRPSMGNGGVDTSDEWIRRPEDSVDEMYRRYFGELYRRRYRSASQHQEPSFKGQRQESPFRDFYRDPPIWPHQTTQDQRRSEDPFSRTRSKSRDERVGAAVFKYYLLATFSLLVVQTLLEYFGYSSTPHPPHGPRIDPKFEENWQKIIFKEPRAEKPGSASATKDAEAN